MDVKVANMLLLSFFIITGASTRALDTEGNKVSAENRQDHPNFEDLSSFFDFELLPPSSSKSPKSKGKYHYSYQPGGPYYPEDQYVPPPTAQSDDDKVTPGSHYKGQKENTSISATSVGGYQVAVVGMDSPVLKDLGLTQEDLVKLAEQKGSTKRISLSNVSLLGSDSNPPSTYAEHPPPQGSYSSPPRSQGSYYPSPTHNKQPWKPHTDWDDKGSHPRHHQPSASTHYHPHPHYHESTPYYPKKPEGYHSSHHHAESSPQYHKKTEGYTPHSSYHPPSGSQHSDSSAYHQKAEGYTPYSSYHQDSSSSYHQKKEGYGGPSYHQDSSPYYQKNPEGYSNPESSSAHSKGYAGSPHHSTDSPAYAKKPEGSYYPRYQAKYPSSSTYPRYKYSSSSKPYSPSSESTAYSSYSKNRAGSTYPHSSEDHHEGEGGQKGITIRFKAKTPGSAGGLSIPVNINPLAVVKKLLPLTSVLNPLNNKKVTIGITIENKKEQHQHAY